VLDINAWYSGLTRFDVAESTPPCHKLLQVWSHCLGLPTPSAGLAQQDSPGTSSHHLALDSAESKVPAALSFPTAQGSGNQTDAASGYFKGCNWSCCKWFPPFVTRHVGTISTHLKHRHVLRLSDAMNGKKRVDHPTDWPIPTTWKPSSHRQSTSFMLVLWQPQQPQLPRWMVARGEGTSTSCGVA